MLDGKRCNHRHLHLRQKCNACKNGKKTADILLLQYEVPTAVNVQVVALAEKHGVKVILNPAPIAPIPKSNQKVVFW